MFSNIGRKIQVLAKVFCWIGISLSVILCLLIIFTDVPDYAFGYVSYGYIGYSIAAKIICGLIVAVLGSLFSWIGSFVLYGLGDLIQTNHDMRDIVRRVYYSNRSKSNNETD